MIFCAKCFKTLYIFVFLFFLKLEEYFFYLHFVGYIHPIFRDICSKVCDYIYQRFKLMIIMTTVPVHFGFLLYLIKMMYSITKCFSFFFSLSELLMPSNYVHTISGELTRSKANYFLKSIWKRSRDLKYSFVLFLIHRLRNLN